jgi:hypothetical protein
MVSLSRANCRPNCRSITQRPLAKLSAREALTDFYFVEADEPEAIQDLLVRLVKERIPARFGFDPKSDVQVLTPMNRSLLGARNLNQVLQTALNSSDNGPQVQRFGWSFRRGEFRKFAIAHPPRADECIAVDNWDSDGELSSTPFATEFRLLNRA